MPLWSRLVVSIDAAPSLTARAYGFALGRRQARRRDIQKQLIISSENSSEKDIGTIITVVLPVD